MKIAYRVEFSVSEFCSKSMNDAGTLVCRVYVRENNDTTTTVIFIFVNFLEFFVLLNIMINVFVLPNRNCVDFEFKIYLIKFHYCMGNVLSTLLKRAFWAKNSFCSQAPPS